MSCFIIGILERVKTERFIYPYYFILIKRAKSPTLEAKNMKKPEGKNWKHPNGKQDGYCYCELCDEEQYHIVFENENEESRIVCQRCGNEEEGEE